MDAINHIPEWLSQWERFSERELLMFLDTYDSKWCGSDDAFSLKQTYLDLKKCGVVY
jgi:hypothetical protein